jgi:hypothetical protein
MTKYRIKPIILSGGKFWLLEYKIGLFGKWDRIDTDRELDVLRDEVKHLISPMTTYNVKIRNIPHGEPKEGDIEK